MSNRLFFHYYIIASLRSLSIELKYLNALLLPNYKKRLSTSSFILYKENQDA